MCDDVTVASRTPEEPEATARAHRAGQDARRHQSQAPAMEHEQIAFSHVTTSPRDFGLYL